MEKVYSINLKLSTGSTVPTLFSTVQGDVLTRKIEATLLNDDGTAFTPGSGVTAEYWSKKPDGTGTQHTDGVTISGNVVTVILTEQDLAAAGRVYAAIRLIDSSDNVLTAMPFYFHNVAQPMGNNIESDNAYQAILEAAEEIENALYYVTPEQYGAVGDGTTDDTTAIQSAVSSGSPVYLSNNYLITSGIELQDGTKLFGFGKGTIIKDDSVETQYAALYHYDDSVISNIVIDGLSIVGVQNWTGATISGTANDFGIRLLYAENVRISNCNIEECGAAAIIVSRSENVVLFGNTITYTGSFTGDTPNYNFGISYNGSYFRIIGNKVSGVIQGIISGLTNTNVVISNNDISTNGQHGLYMESGINVNVHGNVIHDCALIGIKFQLNDETLTEFRNIVINGNVITNCGAQGIYIVDLIKSHYIIQNVNITGNVIECCERAISLNYVYDVQVSNNVVYSEDTSGYGIYIVVSKNIMISDNRLEIVGGIGISFDDSVDSGYNDKIKISDNYIKLVNNTSNAKYAIRLRTASDTMISNNQMYYEGTQTSSDGLFLQNSSTSMSNVYLLSNVIDGYRWDIRAADSTGITSANNYATNTTGI